MFAFTKKQRTLNEIERRRGQAATYTEKLPRDAADLKEFLMDFYRNIMFKRQAEMTEELLKYPKTVGKLYKELVPNVIPYEDFWQRYYYRTASVDRVMAELDAADAEARRVRTDALMGSWNSVTNLVVGGAGIGTSAATTSIPPGSESESQPAPGPPNNSSMDLIPQRSIAAPGAAAPRTLTPSSPAVKKREIPAAKKTNIAEAADVVVVEELSQLQIKNPAPVLVDFPKAEDSSPSASLMSKEEKLPDATLNDEGETRSPGRTTEPASPVRTVDTEPTKQPLMNPLDFLPRRVITASPPRAKAVVVATKSVAALSEGETSSKQPAPILLDVPPVPIIEPSASSSCRPAPAPEPTTTVKPATETVDNNGSSSSSESVKTTPVSAEVVSSPPALANSDSTSHVKDEEPIHSQTTAPPILADPSRIPTNDECMKTESSLAKMSGPATGLPKSSATTVTVQDIPQASLKQQTTIPASETSHASQSKSVMAKPVVGEQPDADRSATTLVQPPTIRTNPMEETKLLAAGTQLVSPPPTGTKVVVTMRETPAERLWSRTNTPPSEKPSLAEQAKQHVTESGSSPMRPIPTANEPIVQAASHTAAQRPLDDSERSPNRRGIGSLFKSTKTGTTVNEQSATTAPSKKDMIPEKTNATAEVTSMEKQTTESAVIGTSTGGVFGGLFKSTKAEAPAADVTVQLDAIAQNTFQPVAGNLAGSSASSVKNVSVATDEVLPHLTETAGSIGIFGGLFKSAKSDASNEAPSTKPDSSGKNTVQPAAVSVARSNGEPTVTPSRHGKETARPKSELDDSTGSGRLFGGLFGSRKSEPTLIEKLQSPEKSNDDVDASNLTDQADSDYNSSRSSVIGSLFGTKKTDQTTIKAAKTASPEVFTKKPSSNPYTAIQPTAPAPKEKEVSQPETSRTSDVKANSRVFGDLFKTIKTDPSVSVGKETSTVQQAIQKLDTKQVSSKQQGTNIAQRTSLKKNDASSPKTRKEGSNVKPGFWQRSLGRKTEESLDPHLNREAISRADTPVTSNVASMIEKFDKQAAPVANAAESKSPPKTLGFKEVLVAMLVVVVAAVVGFVSLPPAWSVAMGDGLCGPVIPGRKLASKEVDVDFAHSEAPWWAPASMKRDTFQRVCGDDRIRSVLKWTEVKPGIHRLELADADHEKLVLVSKKRVQAAHVFANRIEVLTDGKTETVNAPWLLQQR